MKRLANYSISMLVAALLCSVGGTEAFAASAPVSANSSDIMCPAPPAGLDPVVSNLQLAQASGKHSQGADMRDPGYNSQYIFGMTKGIAESTLNPGLKPLMFLFTIPLDIITLPFSAIAGFF